MTEEFDQYGAFPQTTGGMWGQHGADHRAPAERVYAQQAANGQQFPYAQQAAYGRQPTPIEPVIYPGSPNHTPPAAYGQAQSAMPQQTDPRYPPNYPPAA